MNSIIEDGHLFKLLTFIVSGAEISKRELISKSKNEFPEDRIVELVIEEAIVRKLCDEITEGKVKISEYGQNWFDENFANLKDLADEDTSSEDEGLTKPYQVSKLKMEPKVLSIFQALRKVDKKEIKLNPDFQRAFVWDDEKQSRLIESVLIRIPLPAFYLDATNQLEWQVVDGLQRLTTLHNFCNEKSLKLKGLQFLKELEGKTFDGLPKNLQILLEDDTSLQFYNLMPGTPIEAKYTIFSRVNTGGMQLTPQEIRHALSQGKITKVLGELAVCSEFTKGTQGVVDSKRMGDRELVLRAISFMKFDVESYKEYGELDTFLLKSMEKFNQLSDSELANLSVKFKRSIITILEIFGKYAFRKFYEFGGRRSPLNKALFEVWVKSISDLTESDASKLIDKKELLLGRYVSLLNNDNAFLRSISSGTGSFSSVKIRFSKIESLIREMIKSD